MKYKLKALTLLILAVIIISFSAFVSLATESKQESLTAKIFWGEGCSSCEKMKKFFSQMKLKYVGLKTQEYEIFQNENNEKILKDILKRYNKEFRGIPVVIIEENIFTGYGEKKKDDIEAYLAQRLRLSSRKINIGNKPETEKEEKPVIQESKGTNDIGYDYIVKNAEESSDAAKRDRAGRTPEIDDNISNEILMPGNINPLKLPLPAAAIIIALVDSFNPCAVFILISMLGLLMHANSKAKILVAGGTFVLFSGIIYFVFMAAWLNLFLIAGNIKIITFMAGFITLVIAGINIKDFFIFKKGISLTVSQENTKNLFEKMRNLVKVSSWTGIIISTGILALTANAYEVLCTAGFPMIFTRILTLNNLSIFEYYLYLVLYNIVYVLPLAAVVIIISATSGKFKMTEIQGRILKLISGVMMTGLGIVLLINPELLNNIDIMALIVIVPLSIGIISGFINMKKEKIRKR